MDINSFTRSITPFVARAIHTRITKGLRDIYAVGSLSSNEVTVIRNEHSDKIYISDIELIVDVGISTFMICCVKGVAKRLSQELTKILKLRGFKTHVSITITSFALSRLIPSIKPNSVYLYELKRVKLDSSDFTTFSTDLLIRPSKLDSLNLVFSSIADYVFAKLNLFENLTIHEKCYIVAKRCLTLLYSLMLFNEVYPKSYVSRITLAKEHFKKLSNVLSYSDIEVLEALTYYKLSGNLIVLAQKLPTNSRDTNSTLEFLDRYFEELTKKVLMHELAICVYTKEKLELRRSPDNLATLLGEYKSKIQMPLLKRIVYVMTHTVLAVLCSEERDWKKLKVIHYSLLTKGLKIEDLLRYLVSLTFLLVVSGKARNKLKSIYGIKLLWDSFMM